MFDNWTKESKQKLFGQLSEELWNEETKETDEDNLTLYPIKNYLSEALERIEHPDKLYGLDTGYKTLNWITRGFAPQELIIVGGATGEGKTQFVQCLLLHLALQNIPTLFMTLEMPPAEVTARFLEMYKSIGEGSNDIVPELPIYFKGGDDSNIDLLDKSITKAIKEYGIKLVAIDHLHFFSRSVDNEASEIGVITRQMKILARKHNIPIVLISHIKKIYNAEVMPSLDDLRGSSFIAQDADIVIMLRRNYTAQNIDERKIVKVAVKKNRRNGIIYDFKLYNDSNHYLAEDTDEYEPIKT